MYTIILHLQLLDTESSVLEIEELWKNTMSASPLIVSLIFYLLNMIFKIYQT